MDDINDRYSENFIPGTFNIYALKKDKESTVVTGDSADDGVKTSNGVILVPQPTDSPNDPLNYPVLRKVLNFAILAFITGFTAATSNDAGATQDDLNQKYGISYDSMNTGAGVLFIAIGTNTFLCAPASSLYGRKVSYFWCILLGLGGAIWLALSKSTGDTIWNQLFVGASESCAEAHVQQSLSDLYFQHQLGSVLTVYILATSVGTYLGPLIAGFITEFCGFRWVGWTAVIISGGTLLVIFFLLDNTNFDRAKYNKILLRKNRIRAEEKIEFKADKKDEKLSDVDVPNDNGNQINITTTYQESMVSDNGASEPKNSYWYDKKLVRRAPNVVGTGFKQYLRLLKMLFRVFLFPGVIYSGLIWGMQDALLTFYLTVEDDQYYDPPYNYSNTGVALMNVPCLIGAIIGCFFAGVLSDYFSLWMAKRNNGIQEAESRLYFLFLPGVLSPIGLILFAVGTDQTWPWFPTYFGLALIGFGFGAAGDVSMGYLMDAYPDMVIEMMCGVSIINNYIGMVFTFACSPWLEAMGNTNTFIILAVLEFVASMFAVVMIYYGKTLRKKTTKWYLEYCQVRDGI